MNDGTLVEHSQSPQVLFRLSETPILVHTSAIKLRQPNPTVAIEIHIHELLFHRCTFGLPKLLKCVGDLADNSMGIIERVSAHHHGVCCECRRVLRLLKSKSANPAIEKCLNGAPMWKIAVQKTPVTHRSLNTLCVVPQHPMHHVCLQEH